MRLKGKIFLIVILFLLFNVQMAHGDSAIPAFNDIKGSFAEESIIKLTGQGIMDGVGPGLFRPNDSISRLQFAVLMAKTLGIQPVFPSAPVFWDLAPGAVESGYVEALARLGIIRGAGDGVFNPEGPVLRQDAAVFIHRALGEEFGVVSLNERYIDKNLISPYAADSVAYVTGKGWMTGSEKSFYPLRELTRAEAAALAAHLLDARKRQALTAFPSISLRHLLLQAGDSRQIDSQEAKNFPPFTVTYGTDSPEVCPVSPEGIVSGQQSGKGTITVNAGYNSYAVKTEVFSPQGRENLSESVTGKVYSAPETNFDLTCSISQQSPDSGFRQAEQKNSPDPTGGLASSADGWTEFLRQQGRDITVDLKSVRNVTKISMEFRQNPDWGVYWPGYMKSEVSPDGVSWYLLGKVCHGESPDQGVHDVKLTLTCPPVAVRYVRISFPVDVWVFARHLSVEGRTEGAGPVMLAPGGKEDALAGEYMQIPDVRDILLVYTGDRTDRQNLTIGDFLPVVAYQDQTGDIKGRMFDTMLFLPYHDMPCSRDSWDAYIEDLFAPGKQLEALDQAAARVNEVPGLQGKEKVILSIPYPDVRQQCFGTLEKGAQPLSFSDSTGDENAARDRLAAVQWYYNKLMGRWSSAGFKHLELAGIYWYGEVVDQSVPGEKELVQSTARLVRKNNQNFFWIPYFGAHGYENWRSYGFTNVLLQPGYYSPNNPPEDRMDRAADLARRYGMGIEIEFDGEMLASRHYYDLFYEQLKKGHQLGFDGQMTNAYYAGLIKDTLVKAARSNVPEIRAIYDDIHRWISGAFS